MSNIVQQHLQCSVTKCRDNYFGKYKADKVFQFLFGNEMKLNLRSANGNSIVARQTIAVQILEQILSNKERRHLYISKLNFWPLLKEERPFKRLSEKLRKPSFDRTIFRYDRHSIRSNSAVTDFHYTPAQTPHAPHPSFNTVNALPPENLLHFKVFMVGHKPGQRTKESEWRLRQLQTNQVLWETLSGSISWNIYSSTAFFLSWFSLWICKKLGIIWFTPEERRDK